MSMIKWTMESAWAAIAVAITAGGSIYTTVHHGGIVDQQIVDLQNKNTQTETRVEKHDDQLGVIQQQNAATQQSLNDIKDTVHDIQNQVRKHDNHE
jgi:hypothetical protein